MWMTEGNSIRLSRLAMAHVWPILLQRQTWAESLCVLGFGEMRTGVGVRKIQIGIQSLRDKKIDKTAHAPYFWEHCWQ
jgi:hypothetical protein